MSSYFKFSVTIRNSKTLRISATTEVKNLTEARNRVKLVQSVLNDDDEVVIRNLRGTFHCEVYGKNDKV